MKKIQSAILLFLLSTYCCLATQLPEYGLYIQTYPLQAEEFTSMVLDNGKPISTKGKKTSLDFNLWVRNDNVFGSIFRIITDKGTNIDLMYSVSENDKRFPMLVIGNDVHYVSQEVERDTWITVSVSIQPKDGSILLNYNHSTIEVKDSHLKDVQSLRIAFGHCPFEGYSLADVASVNLKDISIRLDEEKIRMWKMSLHHGDDCYDELEHSLAAGHKARWIIDQYITWSLVYSKDFEQTPSIAFDSIGGIFYMAKDKKELYTFHPEKKAENVLEVKSGEFAVNSPNQLIYIHQRRQLLSYNLDENLYSFFNPDTESWENDQAPSKEHDYWNNTLTYYPENASLISFGGYGHYHFNNELLISYPYEANATQHRVNLRDIDPRYAIASTIVDKTLYLFGGRGCPSGKQELSPRNYYDLYAINLATLQATKLWEVSQEMNGKDFQPGENMVYDPKDQCFYVFTTLEGGTLIRITKESPDFELMSLPIHNKLDGQYRYINLYHCPRQSKLYTVIQQTQVNGEAHVDVYEINYPPVPIKSLEQNIETEEAIHSNIRPVIFMTIALLAIIATIGVLYQRKKKHASARQDKKAEEEGTEQPKTADNSSIQQLETKLPEFQNYDFSKQCICFFGGFRVIDKEGNDITSSFTPTLKSLLILLILYTGKDPIGILGHKINQLLWYDKSNESAKNNRNVYISKLRNLMEKVGGVHILNQNGFWKIQFDNDTLCDYLETLRLYEENSNRNLEKLIELLLHGMMLPNMEVDWIDSFKNDFSNTTIDILNRLLKQEDMPDVLKLKIADTLFQHDYINEEALHIKCKILCQQGKKGLAKTVYDTFCKEYAVSLGTAYPIQLKDIIESTL